MSKKTLAGGRRVTVDLAPDVVKILNNARVAKTGIKTITETLEQIIRKAELKTLWN